MSLRVVARWTLAASLIGAAGLKVLADGHGAGGGPWRVAAAAEAVCGLLLLSARTGRIALVAVIGGFLGAAIVTVADVGAGRGGLPCRCLGQVRMSRGESLIGQGLVLLLSGLAAEPRPGHRREPRSPP